MTSADAASHRGVVSILSRTQSENTGRENAVMVQSRRQSDNTTADSLSPPGGPSLSLCPPTAAGGL